MKAAEFMRSLADIIDALDGKDSTDDEVKTPMEEPGNVFVPPLQQEIELRKKDAEVPSSKNKDEFVDDDEPMEG